MRVRGACGFGLNFDILCSVVEAVVLWVSTFPISFWSLKHLPVIFDLISIHNSLFYCFITFRRSSSRQSFGPEPFPMAIMTRSERETESVREWVSERKWLSTYTNTVECWWGWWGGGLAWLEQQPVRALKLVLLYVCLARFALGVSLTFPISRMHGTGSRRTTPSIASTSQSYCIILNYIIRS